MRDVNKAVRVAFLQKIDGKFSFEGYVAYAYHGENPNEHEPLYIIIAEQTDSDDSNKGRFVHSGTILLDIVHRSESTAYDMIDSIAGQVMNALQPTPTTHGLANPAGLQIINVRRLSSPTLPPIPSGEVNILRRLLRYEYTVVEDNGVTGFTIQSN